MNTEVLKNRKLVELTFSELNEIIGGGFWKDVGKFLAGWHGFVSDYSSDGSNPMVLMGGA